MQGLFSGEPEWGEPHDLLSAFQPNCITSLGQFDFNGEADRYEHIPILSEAVTIACARGLDPGALFAALLAGVSAAIPNNVRLQVDPSRHPDWFEPPCIWALLIGAPSTNKSLYHKLATAPLEGYDDALARRSAEARDAFSSARPKSGRGRPPPDRCLLVDDVTSAKLLDLLRDNPDRLMLSSEEAALLINVGLLDRAMYNKAYNGEPQRAQRKTTHSTKVRGACLSMLISSHPDVIRQAVAQPIQDGYWQRFIPIEISAEAFPTGNPCHLGVANYQLHVEAALNSDSVLSRTSDASDYSLYPWENILTFSPEAQAIFDLYRSDIKDLAKVDGILGAHIKKYDKLIARIALILHFLESNQAIYSKNTILNRSIGARNVELAYLITTKYFLPHAYLFYNDYFDNVDNSNAKKAALEIISRNLKRFSASDLKRPRDYDSAIKSLQSAGWIRPVKAYSRIYEVNPNVFLAIAQRHAKLIAKQAEGREAIKRITGMGRFS